MPRTRVIVTGDRHWQCGEVASLVLSRLLARHGPDLVIVHGAAPGVDSAFAEECDDMGIDHEPHAADWEAYGRGAGPRRNAEMVAAGASLCVAAHRNLAGSLGTKDCVRRCLAAGIPVYLIDSERVTPRRLTEV